MKPSVTLFKALSDETRLRIMVLLSEKELCVCQIEAALNLSQAKTSRHLTVLRNAGLVTDRREAQWVYYSLSAPKNKIEASLFEYFRNYLLKEDPFRIDLANIKKCSTQPLEYVSEMADKI